MSDLSTALYEASGRLLDPELGEHVAGHLPGWTKSADPLPNEGFPIYRNDALGDLVRDIRVAFIRSGVSATQHHNIAARLVRDGWRPPTTQEKTA